MLSYFNAEVHKIKSGRIGRIVGLRTVKAACCVCQHLIKRYLGESRSSAGTNSGRWEHWSRMTHKYSFETIKYIRFLKLILKRYTLLLVWLLIIVHIGSLFLCDVQVDERSRGWVKAMGWWKNQITYQQGQHRRLIIAIDDSTPSVAALNLSLKLHATHIS